MTYMDPRPEGLNTQPAPPSVVETLTDEKPTYEELLGALKELSAMYTYAWDLSDDSGLIMFADHIPRFEKIHHRAHEVICKATGMPLPLLIEEESDFPTDEVKNA